MIDTPAAITLLLAAIVFAAATVCGIVRETQG